MRGNLLHRSRLMPCHNLFHALQAQIRAPAPESVRYASHPSPLGSSASFPTASSKAMVYWWHVIATPSKTPSKFAENREHLIITSIPSLFVVSSRHTRDHLLRALFCNPFLPSKPSHYIFAIPTQCRWLCRPERYQVS